MLARTLSPNVLAAVLAAAGLLWGGVAVLDSYRTAGSLVGPLLVGLAIVVRRRSGRSVKGYVVALALVVAYGLSSQVLVEFRGDSHAYFSYLRSASFDGDLDFRNEWKAMGFTWVKLTRTGRVGNVFSVGPAILWSPFYALAHVYVRLDRAFGREQYPLDGFSLPYRRATALGTVTVVVLGGTLLTLALASTAGMKVAILSVVGTFFASPVLYYTFYVPAMSHGVTFGVAAALVWAWHRTERAPSLSAWVLLGTLLGLVTLCRWQALVYLLLVVPLGLSGLRRKNVRWSWLLAGALASILVFVPQLVAWKILFGEWVLMPQGGGFLDWSSPNWWKTLISANHGFLNWTPVMWLGLAGIVLGIRRSRLLYLASLGVVVATVWVNGGVSDWAAGDAFGGRRYSLIVPLMAIGSSQAIQASVRLFQRFPLLVPSAGLVVLGLWNWGFIGHVRARRYPEMAPIERLARDQARSLRHAAQNLLGFIAGPRGRALAYEYFSAEYFYTGFNRSGRINLRSADERYLLRGWHTQSRRTARRTFRRALYPEACVRVPLEEPFDLRVAVTARAPEGALPQVMTVAVNDHIVTSSALSAQFREVSFVVPRDRLVPAENALCLRFSNALPEENGRRVAAHVERIQLP